MNRNLISQIKRLEAPYPLTLMEVRDFLVRGMGYSATLCGMRIIVKTRQGDVLVQRDIETNNFTVMGNRAWVRELVPILESITYSPVSLRLL